MFILDCLYELAKLRDAAYSIVLKEEDVSDPHKSQFLVGFSPDLQVNPTVYFGLPKPLSKEANEFVSVKKHEALLNATQSSEEWQSALSSAVNQLIKEGQTDPKIIAKLATEKTQPEEEKMRSANREFGKVGGISPEQVDSEMTADRESSLKKYIDSCLPKK